MNILDEAVTKTMFKVMGNGLITQRTKCPYCKFFWFVFSHIRISRACPYISEISQFLPKLSKHNSKLSEFLPWLLLNVNKKDTKAFSTYVKFFEKLIFLTPSYVHLCASIRR